MSTLSLPSRHVPSADVSSVDGPRCHLDLGALSRCHLTPRQLDIWALLASGYSNAAIADHLGLTPRWIDNAVGALYGALGIDTLDRKVNARVYATVLYFQRSAAGWP